MVRKQNSVSSKSVEPIANKVLLPDPPTLSQKYWCGCCNFSAKTPSGFRNHLYSNRHYRNWSKDVSVNNVSTPSNDIVKILFDDPSLVSSPIDDNTDTCSGTEPELVVTEIGDIGSDVDKTSYNDEYELDDQSEYASEDEYNNNVEFDEDIDVPLFGTGLFYPEENQSVRISPLKGDIENMPDPFFMASAFLVGMVTERLYANFIRSVYNVCSC